MSLISLSQGKKTTGNGLAALSGASKTIKANTSTVSGLAKLAESSGLGKQAEEIVNETPKLSFLQRLGRGLGAFNPAEAVLTGVEKESTLAGVGKYFSGIAKGVGSAITGRDLEGERRYFSDVAEKLGVENSIAKFGIGLVGDILLDPTTYFGGAIARGLNVAAKGAGKVTLAGIGKLSPEARTGFELVGTGLRDALGRAFEYGYKSTKGAREDVLTFLSKEQKAKLGLAASNLDRLGTGVLTNNQRTELALKMIAGKRAEFHVRESARKIALTSDEFLPISNKLDRIIETRSNRVSNIQKQINRLEKAGLNKKLGEKVTQKQEKLVSGIKIKTVPDAINFDANDVPTGFGRPGYTKTKDIPAITTIRGKQSAKSFIEELIINPNKDIQVLKRKIATKENNLSSIFDEIDTLKTEYQKIQDLKYKRLSLADTTYAQGKRVAREAAESTDPVLKKAIEAQITRSKRFAEGITENPYETYFPFIKNDKLQKFVSNTKGIRVGSEGYRKQFKNLLTNENLELDPAKAFFTRESQIVSDNMTRSFLSGFVKRYGKSLEDFKNADEAIKDGYQLIKEKGAFGKELGYVSQWDAKLIRDSISPEFQTINMLAKATGFDAVTSLFKRSVTGLFAPFHIRNFASGIIQNFEILGKDALNPKYIAAGQKLAYLVGKGEKIKSGTINIAGKSMKSKDVIQPFIDRFSGDTFYNADFELALKNGGELKSASNIFSKTRLKETAKTFGLGQEAIPFKIARGIGQFIEHQQKATAYLAALGQGKTVRQALNMAESAGFDYRALTAFESQILRRIVPFYSFTRKNIELQLKTLGENPQRINQVLRFFGSIGDTPSDEEKKNLPDFIRESIGVKLADSPQGLKRYISSFGTPIEAFTNLFGSNPILRAISTMNPILKVPIEIGIGKDSFRQRDLKDVYTANEYKLAPKVLKDLLEIKEIEKPIYKTVNGKSKIIGNKTAYIADPVRLLIARSLFTSRGVSYLDQVFSNDIEGFIKVLKTTTGIKPQEVDIEAQKFFNERDRQRALEDLLTRYGVTKQFTKTYTPNN